MDCNSPGFSVHGILQARILQWVIMPSSRGSSPPRDPTHVSCRRILYCWATRKVPTRPHCPAIVGMAPNETQRWTEEPGGPQSVGLQRVGHDWACTWCVLQYDETVLHLVCGSGCAILFVQAHRTVQPKEQVLLCIFFLINGVTSQWKSLRDNTLIRQSEHHQ